MLRLLTLGGLSIHRLDQAPLARSTVSASRRQLTLLAVLAAAPRPVARDKLLALFWPESNLDRARHALDQALYSAKRELKADSLFVGRDEIALDAGVITSDIGDFRAALARGDRAAAVELYGGPFLDGVFVSGALEVERWIDDERMQVAREVENALESLATEAAARADHRAAAQWWRRLAAVDPRKTRVIVGLMTELAASGDRAEALRQADVYCTLVREDWDADPNPAVTALVERIRRTPGTPSTPGTSRTTEQSENAHASPDAAAVFAERYVIEREIGRGGAATVYLARDLRHERRVALKVLRQSLEGNPAIDRFRHESAITANLQHPHILALHEWGEADGTLYFAMPYVEGESLRARLDRERRLSVHDAVRLANEIAGALAYAHARGIVHRDVKPENILLSSGHALVADFGVALAVAKGVERGQRRTDPGVILGTPAYLSPEQAAPGLDPDPRSDQYSLACVVYEMLTGAPPFSAADSIELVARRVGAPPASVRMRRASVPKAVDRAVLRALSVDAAQRFPDIAAFARALETHARPRLPLAIAGFAAAVLVGAFAWRMLAAPTLAARAWIVVADVENSTRDTIFDRSIDFLVSAGLAQSAYVNLEPPARIHQTLIRMRRAAPDSASSPIAITADVAREIAIRDGAAAVLATSIDRTDSTFLLALRLIDARTGETLAAEQATAQRRSDVIPAFDDLVRRMRRAIGESRKQLAAHDRPLPFATTPSLEALRAYANSVDAYDAGNLATAMDLQRSAIALDSDFALARADLGLGYALLGDRANARLQYAKALSLGDRLSERERLRIRAGAEEWIGDPVTALDLRKAILEQYPDDPSAWANLGYAYLRLERYAEAADAYRRQIARDSTNATDYWNLAVSLTGMGRLEDALASYRKAAAVKPTLVRAISFNREYGRILVLTGHVDEAVAVDDTLLHGDPDMVVQGERSIGFIDMYQGRYRDAYQHFRRATLIGDGPAAGGGKLSAMRNHLFAAAVERDLGGAWRDSVRADLMAAYRLFRTSGFDPAYLARLGKALAREGDVARAREVLDTLNRRAIDRSPTDQASRQLLAGEVALAGGHPDTAMMLFRLVVSADSSPYAEESLAQAMAARGDLVDAASLFERIAGGDWFGADGESFGLTADLQAGMLYEQEGDVANAQRAYAQQLTRWTRPDSALGPLVDARTRLARLSSQSARR